MLLRQESAVSKKGFPNIKTTTVPIEQIRIDGDTQPRVQISDELVAEYVEQLKEGTEFPPVTIFFDGADHWLADGFHRYHAHRQLDRKEIAADVHKGGQREAILFAVGANCEHGQWRTNLDKHKAVVTMLTNKLVYKDADGNPLSDAAIGRLCKVHYTTVGRIRKELSRAKHGIATKRVVKRGNSVYVQNTSGIQQANKKRKRKQYGGIAPNAVTPTRKPKTEMRKTPLEMPHSPEYGARTLLSAMGEEYVDELIEWLQKLREAQRSNHEQD